jgi:hypothetical protein
MGRNTMKLKESKLQKDQVIARQSGPVWIITQGEKKNVWWSQLFIQSPVIRVEKTNRSQQFEGFFAKYSMNCKVLCHHGWDNNEKRLTEHQFPRIPPVEKKCKTTGQCVVCSKQNKRRETVLLSELRHCSVHRWQYKGLPHEHKLLRQC